MSRSRTLSLLVPGLVLLVLGLPACDSQSPGPSSDPSRFSLTVQVEDPSGAPIDDARVGVRPCFRLGGLDCGPRLCSSARSEPSSKNDARTASQHLRITEPSSSSSAKIATLRSEAFPVPLRRTPTL